MHKLFKKKAQGAVPHEVYFFEKKKKKKKKKASVYV